MKVRVDLSEQLYRLLPEVYRVRDNPDRDSGGEITEPGDLALWLEAQGVLLNQVHRSLVQMLYDHFPDEADSDENGTMRSCQPWLLPYFAQLLDVALVSPELRGQRAEIAKAVAWRQSKGTLPCVEDIAQDVGQHEVEIQEGWRRLAVTPRVGYPILPARALGEPAEMDMDALPPGRRALHPGLNSGTVDFRRRSRAVQCESSNPAAHATHFAGVSLTWRRIHPHAVPCLPGSYQDGSARLPDLRTPAWNRGHFHPRRLLLYLPPPAGFCSPLAVPSTWTALRDAPLSPANAKRADSLEWEGQSVVLQVFAVPGKPVEVAVGTVEWQGHAVPFLWYRGTAADPVKITGVVDLNDEAVYRFENLWLDKTLDMQRGKLEMTGCAARKVIAQPADISTLDMQARACLFKTLQVARGLARLEYCTVLQTCVAEALQASDCIFLPRPRKNVDPADTAHPHPLCARYSRLPSPLPPEGAGTHAPKSTTVEPWFYSDLFGSRGCGVLHPGAAAALRFGAEDGGEMGAYHDRRYTLREEAVLDKLAEFIPVGQEAVLIPDTTLWCPPPQSV